MRPRSSQRAKNGCLVVVVYCLTTCLLLAANRVLVVSAYAAVVPQAFDVDKLRTLFQFLAMVALVVPEWWVLDKLLQKWRQVRRAVGHRVGSD